MNADIVIKTRVDMSGLQTGVRNVSQAAKAMADDLSENLSKAVDLSEIIDEKEMTAAAERLRDTMETVAGAMGEGFESVVSNMQSAFLQFVETGEFSFRDMVNAIIKDLARISFETFITNPLQGFINGLTQPSKTGGPSVLGSFLTSLIHPSPGKALGGPVSFGRPYVVGERGRELFVPHTSGKVMPNHAMGGGQIVFNVNATDAQSFQRSETQIAAMLNRMVRRGQRNL